MLRLTLVNMMGFMLDVDIVGPLKNLELDKGMIVKLRQKTLKFKH